MNKDYIDTVRLLLEAAPSVFHRGVFPVNEGAAINLFARAMPRHIRLQRESAKKDSTAD